MSELTVERLFDNPPLTGTLPLQPTWSPDGTVVAFLRPAADDRERLDLWRLDVATGESALWIDARELMRGDSTLSDAEKAERERKRLFATGITSYAFSPDGTRLLLPVDGVGYLYELESKTLTAFTPPGTRQTEFRFSPQGRFVSYVRAGDLYVYEISAEAERAITRDGGDTVANGIADFIAQEEMHRFEGHWWSADEQRLAFTRSDEAPVAVSRRYEIDADTINVIEQRYPYAGARNADVDLKVFDFTTAETTNINYAYASDDYLARVAWAGSRLAVQVQTRDQQILKLDLHEADGSNRRTLLLEESPTWINLHDNFKALDEDRFLWTSEREGNAQLYLYTNGEPTRLTDGTGRVNKVLHADNDRVLFSGWQETPTEQHAFSLQLADGTRERLTATPGWHELIPSPDGSGFIDRWTSLDSMGGLSIETGGRQTHIEDGAAPAYTPFQGSHVTPTLGTLTAEDGQTLHYRLTRPTGEGPHPLIVYVYGGPGVHRVKNEWPPLLLQLFASHGFGVLELDNRGSSNRGRDFEAPIYRRMGDAEVRDQRLGAEFAQGLDWVDGERIGVFGHSYGGYMTLMCLARAGDVFKAGVSAAPVTAWELYDTHYTERYLATPEDNPEGYGASAVFPYLDELKGKLLVMHGMADDNVLFTHTTRLIKALQNRCQPFEMMAYPGSKHALQERTVSIHRFNLILDFFERTLGA